MSRASPKSERAARRRLPARRHPVRAEMTKSMTLGVVEGGPRTRGCSFTKKKAMSSEDGGRRDDGERTSAGTGRRGGAPTRGAKSRRAGVVTRCLHRGARCSQPAIAAPLQSRPSTLAWAVALIAAGSGAYSRSGRDRLAVAEGVVEPVLEQAGLRLVQARLAHVPVHEEKRRCGDRVSPSSRTVASTALKRRSAGMVRPRPAAIVDSRVGRVPAPSGS